jgi:ATP-dependent Clp protease ATP-binding subunit ClpC
MTSNVGATRIRTRPPVGFTPGGEEDELSYEEVKREVDRELERSFSREFLNRIDEAIVFQSLSREALREIIGLLLEEMVPFRLELSEEALDLLVERSYEPALGARPVRRTIQRLIRNPLSLMRAKGKLARNDTIEVFVRDGELAFATDGRAPKPRDMEAGGRR